MHVCSRYRLGGVANRSIAQSFALLHSAQLETALIAWRTWESTVAIVISTNLKRLEPWASKQADIGVKGHIICPYMWNAPNSECLGQQDSMHLITNMRL
jgi:hypothetical protein